MNRRVRKSEIVTSSPYKRKMHQVQLKKIKSNKSQINLNRKKQNRNQNN